MKSTLFFRLSSALCLTFLFAVSLTVSNADTFPDCGTCWCVPGNGGLDPCPVDWQPQTEFNDTVIGIYKSQKPLTIFSLSCNPYDEANCTTSPPQQYLQVDSAVCGYKYSKSPNTQNTCTFYEMVTYPSIDDALLDGAVLTHSGSCGVCSTTQDLAIYLSKFLPDFSASVRALTSFLILCS